MSKPKLENIADLMNYYIQLGISGARVIQVKNDYITETGNRLFSTEMIKYFEKRFNTSCQVPYPTQKDSVIWDSESQELKLRRDGE